MAFDSTKFDIKTDFCKHCRKVKSNSSKGSFTSWIFDVSRCQCNSEVKSPEEQEEDSYIGLEINSRYKILSPLGDGGMGAVYLAKDNAKNVIVAIKLVKEELAQNENAMQRFHQEFVASQYLVHPNMVSVYECGFTSDGIPFLVMEYVDGISLDELISREEKLTTEQAIDIAIAVCEALEDAHQKDIIHRDVKPGNIIVAPCPDREYKVKLVDFGIAKVVYGSMDSSTKFTRTSTGMVGTPNYMSPEQCEGKVVSAASDIYSLGCVMYHMLTGQPPFENVNPVKVVLMHLSEEVKPIIDIVEDCDLKLDSVVLKCLRKDPSKRYLSVKELKGDLIAIRSGRLDKLSFNRMMIQLIACSILAVVGVVAVVVSSLPPKDVHDYIYGKSTKIYAFGTKRVLFERLGVHTKRSTLAEAVKNKANLSGADLRMVNLSGLILKGVNLQGANLRNAVINGTDFTSANLSYADLTYCESNKAIFQNANLQGAVLIGANMSESNLGYANLQSSDLSYAKLDRVVFKGAILKHAVIQSVTCANTDLMLNQVIETCGLPRTKIY